MHVKTCHGTLVVYSSVKGLHHLPRAACKDVQIICVADAGDTLISGGPLDGYSIKTSSNGKDFFLSRNGLFLSADGSSDILSCNRTHALKWETFDFASELQDDDGAMFIAPALRDYQLGNLRRAVNVLDRAKIYYPKNDIVLYHWRNAHDLLIGRTPFSDARLRLITQCDPDKIFETQWLNFLLDQRSAKLQYDRKRQVVSDYMVVIDSHIREGSLAYYRDAFERGCRILLLHLSDESFLDDTNAYKWCHAVWRNIWSPSLASDNKIKFFALGFKTGFVTDSIPLPTLDRRYVWSFAGDVKKSTRPQMIDSMNKVKNGHLYTTLSFGSSDALCIEDYRGLMDQTIFVPCPAGFHCLDSFRVYEALEAGCIPIVERRPGFDYFHHLLGEYPFPVVSDWVEAPEIIAHLQSKKEEDGLRLKCYNWWCAYKVNLRAELANSILNLSADRY